MSLNDNTTLRHAVLDVESFFSDDVNARLLGVANYLRQTDVYLLSYADTDGVQWVGPPDDFDFSLLYRPNQIVWCHSAQFDLTWLQITGRPLPAHFNCTANLAASMGAPRSLKAAAHVLLRLDISKDVREEMRGRNFHLLDPAEQGKVRVYALTDAVVSLQLVTQLYHLWIPAEAELSRSTIEMVLAGIAVNEDALRAQIKLARAIQEEAASSIPWDRPLSRKSAFAACTEAGVEHPESFCSKNPGFKRWIEKYEPVVPWVRHVADFRRANLLIRRGESMLRRIMPDGRLRYEIMFHGCHTGRFSGSEGLNVQNFSRNAFKGVDLRSVITAKAGCQLAIIDLAQIEPRILATLAGDFKLLEKMREGWSVYEAQAISWGLWQGEKGTFKGSRPELYLTVKQANLGAGYGMGPERFIATVESQTNTRLTLEEAEARIQLYRKSNPLVCAHWRRCDAELRLHASSDHIADYELPSGRHLSFVNLRWEKGLPPIKPHMVALPAGEHVEKQIWGGHITQGLTQAIARDVFALGILRLRAAGFNPVLHVHDEVVCEVPIGTKLEDLITIFAQPPPWGLSIPIAAEGIISEHYCKP